MGLIRAGISVMLMRTIICDNDNVSSIKFL